MATRAEILALPSDTEAQLGLASDDGNWYLIAPNAAGTTAVPVITEIPVALTLSFIGVSRGPGSFGTTMDSAADLWVGANPSVRLVSMGSVVTSLVSYAFEGCDYMYGPVVFSQNLVTIGEYAFNYTGSSGLGLGALNLPDSVVTVDTGAFQLANFDSVNLGSFFGSALTTIGDDAFNVATTGGASFGDLVIPLSVANIGDNSFKGTAMDDVYTALGIGGVYSTAFDTTGAGNIYVAPAVFAGWPGTRGSKTVLEWQNYPNPIPN